MDSEVITHTGPVRCGRRDFSRSAGDWVVELKGEEEPEERRGREDGRRRRRRPELSMLAIYFGESVRVWWG